MTLLYYLFSFIIFFFFFPVSSTCGTISHSGSYFSFFSSCEVSNIPNCFFAAQFLLPLHTTFTFVHLLRPRRRLEEFLAGLLLLSPHLPYDLNSRTVCFLSAAAPQRCQRLQQPSNLATCSSICGHPITTCDSAYFEQTSLSIPLFIYFPPTPPSFARVPGGFSFNSITPPLSTQSTRPSS